MVAVSVRNMSCTTTKLFESAKGINSQPADRIRADHVKRLQFAGLRRFHHLRQAQTFFRRQLAPFLLELGRASAMVRIPAEDRDKAPFRWRRANSRNRPDRSALLRSASKQNSPISRCHGRASSEPKAMTRFCSAANFLAQRRPGFAGHAVADSDESSRESSPARNATAFASAPAGTSPNPAACRRNLMGAELIT